MKTKHGWTNLNSNNGIINTLVQNRPGNMEGGGIAITYRKVYKTIQLKGDHKPTMEYALWKIIIKNKPIHILGIYHLPTNAANKTMNRMFLDDLTDLLTEKIPKLSNTIIMGDFNINTEDVSNADTVMFNDTMQALSLNQHAIEPM